VARRAVRSLQLCQPIQPTHLKIKTFAAGLSAVVDFGLPKTLVVGEKTDYKTTQKG
jgi:hypothetical protein